MTTARYMAGLLLTAGMIALFPVLQTRGQNVNRIYRVSAYCQNECCCQGSADGITSSGHRITKADYGRIVAAPRSIKFGTVLHIEGLGRDVVVEDRGGAIKDAGEKVGGTVLRYPRLDILCSSHNEAREFGVKLLTVTTHERE